MGTIRRTRDHPRRQEGPVFRTRDRRVRTLQTKNQNVALHPIQGLTHEYEIDSPSKRPAASVPLSIRDPPVSILTPRSLTEVIPYEGGLQPTFGVVPEFLAIRKAMSLEARPSFFVIPTERASRASGGIHGEGRSAVMPGSQIPRFASLTRDDRVAVARFSSLAREESSSAA